MKSLAISLVAAAGASLLIALPTRATSVPTEWTESFEGMTVGGNIVSPGGVYLRIVGPVTFSTGLQVTAPFPQPDPNRAMLINDFVYGGGFGLGDLGLIDRAAQVPHGTAFFAVDDNEDHRPVEFMLPLAVRRVSAAVTGAFVAAFPPPNPPGRQITLTAFDASGNVLATDSVESVHGSLWSSNVISVEAAGIAKVQFVGNQMVIDNLKFSLVPEPATSSLAACAGLALAAMHRARRRSCPQR